MDSIYYSDKEQGVKAPMMINNKVNCEFEGNRTALNLWFVRCSQKDRRFTGFGEENFLL